MSINTSTILNKRRRYSNKGFTLLEALIAFMILSVGMLGIASLQVVSQKAGKTAVYNSVAMMKVEELFESMRANPGVLANYVGAGFQHDCFAAKNCTEVELAEDDVYWWGQNLTSGLPSSAATTVTVTAAVAPSKMATVNITVNWQERSKTTVNAVNKSFTTSANICTEIPC